MPQRNCAPKWFSGEESKRVRREIGRKSGRNTVANNRDHRELPQSCERAASITLTSAGLPAALAELAAKVPAEVKFHWPHSERIDFEPMLALHVYRIAEEAVTNAVKHAGAKNITIWLAIVAGRPVLEIADDGKGIRKKLKTEGMGLRNMRYRANVIGGELTVEAHKGEELVFVVLCPLANQFCVR